MDGFFSMDSIGPYRLDSELGHGAMGVVFRGFDAAIGRAVAIKIIQLNQFATASEKAEIKLRFAREAAAAGKLAHPNIVTVYQLGEQGDLQYLVLELVEGWSQCHNTGMKLQLIPGLAILCSLATLRALMWCLSGHSHYQANLQFFVSIDCRVITRSG
jgi:hypothetical protein